MLRAHALETRCDGDLILIDTEDIANALGPVNSHSMQGVAVLSPLVSVHIFRVKDVVDVQLMEEIEAGLDLDPMQKINALTIIDVLVA